VVPAAVFRLLAGKVDLQSIAAGGAGKVDLQSIAAGGASPPKMLFQRVRDSFTL